MRPGENVVRRYNREPGKVLAVEGNWVSVQYATRVDWERRQNVCRPRSRKPKVEKAPALPDLPPERLKVLAEANRVSLAEAIGERAKQRAGQ